MPLSFYVTASQRVHIPFVLKLLFQFAEHQHYAGLDRAMRRNDKGANEIIFGGNPKGAVQKYLLS